MMRHIRKLFARRRPTPKTGGKRNPENTAVTTATKADQGAIGAGRERRTKTDRDREQIPADEREAGLTKQFIEFGLTKQEAQQLAKVLVQENLSYHFNPEQLDGSQMFNVRSKHGVLHVNLNTDHPIYEPDQIHRRKPRPRIAMRATLYSWPVSPSGYCYRRGHGWKTRPNPEQERRHIQDIAMNWGRQVDKTISQLRESDD